MAPFVLKFKGNKSFSPFSNLGDGDSLAKTWKVCTKVAAHLEQGQRLENLSWRMWHLQTLMVEDDNAKSRREFKKMSKNMGERLDKDKGRSIEELGVPALSESSLDKIRRRTEDRATHRKTHDYMTFTFPADPATNRTPGATVPISHPPSKKPQPQPRDLTVDTNGQRTPVQDGSSRTRYREHANSISSISSATSNPGAAGFAFTPITPASTNSSVMSIKFPNVFDQGGFGPTALLCTQPSTTPARSFGEGVGSQSHDLGVMRPTFEVGLDELMSSGGDGDGASSEGALSSFGVPNTPFGELNLMQGVVMQPNGTSHPDLDLDGDELVSAVGRRSAPASPALFPLSVTPTPTTTFLHNHLAMPNLPGPTPHRISRRYSTTNAPRGREGHSATAAPRAVRAQYSNNTAPGGVKSECANCGANSTPLWRRGLNDELNCNACGLFAKLHKRPRPKSLRNSTGGESGTRNPGWASSRTGDETGEPVSCFNCSTIATPLWRKDEEGRTLCNACGLYLKLHGEKRPSSMKSDVIRKRSRHDARRGTSSSETPSASPGASRRTSPTPPTTSPTLPVSVSVPADFASPASWADFSASPVETMTMDPMTFSPGLTYTETLHYPGPFSLSYYLSQYGLPPADAPQQQRQYSNGAQEHQQPQQPQQQQQWDHQGFSAGFSNNFGFTGSSSGYQQDSGLGVVHPPMMPYWSADIANGNVAKTEAVDHDMSFGRH